MKVKTVLEKLEKLQSNEGFSRNKKIPEDAEWFVVHIEQGNKSAEITLKKQFGGWKEYANVNDDNIELGRKKYQSYLKPKDILDWLRQDFDRVEVLDFDPAIDDEDDDEIGEGMHYGTKIRQVEGSYGTRKAKMAIREAKRIVENYLDTNHPSPNPVSDDDKQLLLDSVENLSNAMTKVVEAKVGKRIRKNEAKGTGYYEYDVIWFEGPLKSSKKTTATSKEDAISNVVYRVMEDDKEMYFDNKKYYPAKSKLLVSLMLLSHKNRDGKVVVDRK